MSFGYYLGSAHNCADVRMARDHTVAHILDANNYTDFLSATLRGTRYVRQGQRVQTTATADVHSAAGIMVVWLAVRASVGRFVDYVTFALVVVVLSFYFLSYRSGFKARLHSRVRADWRVLCVAFQSRRFETSHYWSLE